MTVYYILYIFVIAFGLLQYIKFRENKKAKIIYLIATGLFLIIIGGFRLGIGFDYRPYFVFFEDVASVPWSELRLLENEIGFNVFIKIITLFSKNPQSLYIISTVIMVTITFFIIYKFSKIPMISILLYLSTNAFISGMNLLRYTMAAIITFLGFCFLKKSKLEFSKESFTVKNFMNDFLFNFLPYSLIILLAASFHKSALVLIPIYYLVKIPFNYITMLIYTGFVIIYFIFSDVIITMLSNVFYEGMYNATHYLDPGGYQHATFHIIFLIILILSFEKLIKRDKTNLVYVNMYFYSAALYIIVAFKTFILSRITLYFYLYIILLIPEIISLFLPTEEEFSTEKTAVKSKKQILSKKELAKIKKIKDRKIYHSLSLIFGIFLTILIQYNAITSTEYGAHGVFPYRSILPGFNNFNQLNFNNDREKKAKSLTLSAHNNDPDISTYLTNVNDPDYLVFLSFSGTGTNYMHSLVLNQWRINQWALEPYKNLGLEANFTNTAGQGYVAISDGGNVVFEKLDLEVIIENLEISGLKVEIKSGGNLSGTPLSSIIIDGKDYADSLEGINIVVYDKILKKIVDAVHYSPYNYRLPPSRIDMEYTYR